MRYCNLFFLGVIPRAPNRIACIVLRCISIFVPIHVFFSSLPLLAFPRRVCFGCVVFRVQHFCRVVCVRPRSPVVARSPRVRSLAYGIAAPTGSSPRLCHSAVRSGWHRSWSLGWFGCISGCSAVVSPIRRSVGEHPYIMDEYLVTAFAKGRVAGPFPSPPVVTLPGSPSPTKPFRLLRRRPRFAVPGTPVAARLSGCAVVFTTQVVFLPVPRGISGWWRLGRSLVHRLPNHRVKLALGRRVPNALVISYSLCAVCRTPAAREPVHAVLSFILFRCNPSCT